MKTGKLWWQLICFQPWLILLITVLWIMIQGLPLVGGWVLREIFNTLTNDAPATLSVWTLLVLFVLATVGREIGRFIVFSQEPLVTNRTSALLSRNLLNHILSLPGAQAIAGAPGELVSRFRGDAGAIAVFMIWSPTNIGRLFFAIVAVSVMAQINPFITLGVLVPLVIISGIIRITRSRIEMYRRVSREAAGTVSETIGEMFGAVQAIKVANAETGVIGHFRKVNDHRRVVALRDRLLDEVQGSLFGSTVDISTGVILLLAAQSMQGATFTLGDFSLFTFYLWVLGDYIGMFGVFVARYKQLGISFERVAALLKFDDDEAQVAALVEHQPIYIQATEPPLPKLRKQPQDHLKRLQIEAVGYQYPNTDKGVRDVGFEIPAGSFTVITGQIGSGKTTLLRTILGLLPKDQGQIRWNDQVINEPTTFFVPPRSAYTPQVPRLFSDSLRDNILLGLPEDTVAIDAAIQLAVMEDDLVDMTDGLDTVVGPRGVRLSGGQLQRTAVARMMVRETELIVCDDVSSALDVETERELWTRIFRQKNVTCLVVSHRRAILERADQIVVLKDGQVEDIGKLPALLDRCMEMQLLWNQAYQHGGDTDVV
ncbi:MAG: ABC transporter ATP-binding protein [Chloroflexota bacterium]